MGIRQKMFGYFVFFCAIVLIVMGLFQVVFLDDIYLYTAKNETADLANAVYLASKLDEKSFKARVLALADESSSCISVYRISGGVGREVAGAHCQPACLLHSSMLNESLIDELYAKSKSEEMHTRVLTDDRSDPESLIVAMRQNSEGAETFVIVNTPLASVDAALSTLQYQYVIVAAILLVIAGIMAYIIASRFTRPVRAMNKEAKKLALGNYDVDFKSDEFLETAELGLTLNYAAEELSKLDTVQKELISNISHDLRTPLTMISGYSEVMRDIPDERTAENMQIVIDETKRLSSLVSDMLDLSRLAGGKRELKLTEFSLTECIRQTISRYSHLCEKDGYNITFRSDEEVYVTADEILILQVIYNLISNAINYTGNDKLIMVDQTVEGTSVRISVSDTGMGIEEDKLPYIWDRYYRTGDYHKRGISGTGLGLSIVKNALVLHSAPFGVSSTPGAGSTFWFELPTTKK